MRSNAPASPCWARRMASASVISLVSVGLVRVTVPVGTHPVCGMRPCLLELHLVSIQMLVCQWSRLSQMANYSLRAGPALNLPVGRQYIDHPTPFSMESLRTSRDY